MVPCVREPINQLCEIYARLCRRSRVVQQENGDPLRSAGVDEVNIK